MEKLHVFVKKIFVRFYNAVAPSKISSVKVEGKKNSFSKVLQLIKYEREKIPLPKVTLPEVRDEKDEKLSGADEESAFQHYYLYQFINTEKQQEFERRRKKNQKQLAHVISFMHFLSMTYPTSKARCGPAMNVRLYNPTIQSVTFNVGKSENQLGR
ncbi:hypothetical protein [Neorickettsia sennetsu]|uniref:Uncharacterized protein n=1 Tax=Ehrlichia sennetsu (strain ATCC VR-367 / Miyayama) TaxID=222891 RepID=Q2GD67_EHRS3|nr:hypothetical protein [Neorickettsia sennetsu]ABD46486.1 hypothetical protein NSE_0703 [Neorickettsia sennetsu str. Miyayama]